MFKILFAIDADWVIKYEAQIRYGSWIAFKYRRSSSQQTNASWHWQWRFEACSIVHMLHWWTIAAAWVPAMILRNKFRLVNTFASTKQRPFEYSCFSYRGNCCVTCCAAPIMLLAASRSWRDVISRVRPSDVDRSHRPSPAELVHWIVN